MALLLTEVACAEELGQTHDFSPLFHCPPGRVEGFGQIIVRVLRASRLYEAYAHLPGIRLCHAALLSP